MTKAPGANCQECPCRDRPVTRLPSPSPTARLVVVGEVPFSRSPVPYDAHLTGAVLCAPQFGDDRALERARKCCLGRLSMELDSLPGLPVIAMGREAALSTLRPKGRPGIMDMRGSVNRVAGRLVFPTLDPFTVRRAPIWEPVLEHDLKRVVKYLEKTDYVPPEEAVGRVTYYADEALAHLDELGSTVSLDVETTRQGPTEAKLVCVGLSDGRISLVIPWTSDLAGTTPFWPSLEPVATALNRALASRVVVTHNGQAFDFIVLQRHGIRVKEWEDTLLAQHTIASHLPKRLGHVVAQYLDAPAWKQEHASGDSNIEEEWRYNGRDVLYTRLSWEAMQRELEQTRAVYLHDKVNAEFCRGMSVRGIAFDVSRARQFGEFLRNREAELQQKASELIGREINLLSTAQLKKLFFAELRAPVFFRTDKGQASLAERAMQGYAALADQRISALAKLILEYRGLRKARSTYVEGVELGSDGRRHPNWRSYGTVTGRFASDMQQLPRPANDPTIQMGGIRSLYIAGHGKVLIGFDAKQLEIRIAAYWSNDPAMQAACESADIHSYNAELVFGEAFVNGDKALRHELRAIAKTFVFAINYGAAASTVHQNLVGQGYNVTLGRIEAAMGKLKRAFNVYYGMQNAALMDVTRRGWALSPIIGRRRWFGHSPRPTEVNNYPIQSGAADLLNLKMPLIDAQVRKIPGAGVIAQIHDAGYVECYNKDAGSVEEIFQEVFGVSVGLGGAQRIFPIDVKSGERMSDL